MYATHRPTVNNEPARTPRQQDPRTQVVLNVVVGLGRLRRRPLPQVRFLRSIEDVVVIITTEDPIVSRTAQDQVASRSAIQMVVAGTAVDTVIANQAIDRIDSLVGSKFSEQILTRSEV